MILITSPFPFFLVIFFPTAMVFSLPSSQLYKLPPRGEIGNFIDPCLKAVAFESLGYIGISLEGKSCLASLGNKMINCIEKLEHLIQGRGADICPTGIGPKLASQYAFKTIFFLPCVPDFMALLAI